jgi:hypothetical protein
MITWFSCPFTLINKIEILGFSVSSCYCNVSLTKDTTNAQREINRFAQQVSPQCVVLHQTHVVFFFVYFESYCLCCTVYKIFHRKTATFDLWFVDRIRLKL